MKLFFNISVALCSFFLFEKTVNGSISTDGATFSGRVGGDVRTIYSDKTLANVEGIKNTQTVGGLNQSGHVTLLTHEIGDIVVREVDM